MSVHVCMCVRKGRHPWLTLRDQEVQSRLAQTTGVEEDEDDDEVLEIMKQKILNNLFSLSTVAPHMALTLYSSSYKITEPMHEVMKIYTHQIKK